MNLKNITISFLFIVTLYSWQRDCKYCEGVWEPQNGATQSDLNDFTIALGFTGWDEWMSSNNWNNGNYCDDRLDYFESRNHTNDLNGDGLIDCRVFWECD